MKNAWTKATAAALPGVGAVLVAETGASPLGGWRFRYDVDIYLAAAAAFNAGGDPYSVVTERNLGFTYPPAALMPFVVLSRIPPDVLYGWWNLVIATVVAVTFYLTARSCGLWETASEARIMVASAAVVVTEPVYDSMHLGQASPMVAGLATIGVVAVSSRAGALTGVASAVKITPLGLLVAMAARSDFRRRIAWMFVAAGGITALAWVSFPDLSMRYWTVNLWETGRVGGLGSASNTSMAGLFSHSGMTDGPAFLAGTSVAAVLMVWWFHKIQANGNPNRADLALGAGSGIVLLTPVSWSHHALVASLAAGMLFLAGRHGYAFLLTACWALPIFQWASTWSQPWAFIGQIVRPITLIALIVVTARIGVARRSERIR
ncbi:MAG: glycosyltransferase family 87 protein [Actinomycetota bacterium]